MSNDISTNPLVRRKKTVTLFLDPEDGCLYCACGGRLLAEMRIYRLPVCVAVDGATENKEWWDLEIDLGMYSLEEHATRVYCPSCHTKYNRAFHKIVIQYVNEEDPEDQYDERAQKAKAEQPTVPDVYKNKKGDSPCQSTDMTETK